ncbi:HAMP domain-containing histidine kinase [Shimazuella sp. AN120528]|uniref:sensor histidine kinase n=1 Tax=Shimazuella soli TaxID=1892854 RepID=UPI001F0EA813|nr:HAMP domain-containing sensor histidine kinase [Shimazuella soli]MCH5586510.1 HAMP domain-containing histidine kinase [Shimazuella soli]
MARLKKVLGPLAGIGIVLFFWSLSYWLVNLLFPTLKDVTSEYVKDLLIGFLGFVLMMSTMYLIGKIFSSRRDDVFHVIVDAIKQISKGNFKVKLNLGKLNKGHPFAALASSINDMAEELGEMEKMRQTFISNVSHEIQSPLTSIRGFARALQNNELSPSQRTHYIDIIITESIRLSKLSDNLMKLTSLESEHHPFVATDYRLDKQLQQVILVNEPQWLGKKITVEPILEEITIYADADLLNQVWTNLLHNSIKFTDEHGSITISLKQTGENTVVQFTDTGSGISEEDQLHIFERFYKGDKSRNRNAGGSGLGLSIVKKIVELHHGTIQVESKLGEGTTITVSIPLKYGK